MAVIGEDHAPSEVVDKYREEGYATVRGFVDAQEMIRPGEGTGRVREAGLEHHATFRRGDLAFEILPEASFGGRYLIQAHRFARMGPYFGYENLLETPHRHYDERQWWR